MKRSGEAGLTLVELMIVVVISSLVISAALGMGFSMMNSYREHRAMINVERSARVSLEIIADAIRNSTPGVPLGNFEDIVGCTGQVAGLQVINNTDAPDELKLIYATGGIFTSVYQETGYGTADIEVTVIDADPDQGGIDGQDFFADDYFIITNLDSGAVVKVTGVSAPFDCGDAGTPVTCYTLTTTQPSSCGGVTWPAGGYETGALVIRGRYARFYIENSADTGNVPTLMMDPDADGDLEAEPIAEGIEDMQIAIAVDADPVDGSITEIGDDPDDDEWYYNVDGDADPPALVPRALRITLVAMSIQEQSDVDSYTRPAAEDHAADGVKDPFRRRVLSTTIEIRNLTGSP